MWPIYLDASATTPLLPPVWEAMLPYFAEQFGNPSSSHRFGRFARRGLDDARETIAHCLDCRPDEVLFTSGATEANNLALFGLAGTSPGTILSSPLEHPCVTGPLEQLTQRGFRLMHLAATSAGIVSLPSESASSLPSDTRLAALQLANHEIGTVQPVRAFADLLGPIPLHCDAAAAVGKMPLSFRELGVAALTLSAHKFHGPKGIGALVLRRGTRLPPQIWGGHQQQGKRPGTEPVPLIVGMAKALQLATDNLDTSRRHVQQLRDRFLQLLQDAAPLGVNGALDHAVPHTLNVSFPGCRGDALLMKLDLAGIACSTGSACSSGSLLPSPVIQALGAPGEVLHSALRFSFLASLTLADVEEAGRRIVKIVKDLRLATP